MGVLCSKEFRLKIGNPVDTSRLVYYKMDSYAGSIIDSSQGRNLTGGAFPPTVVPGVIGNGYQSIDDQDMQKSNTSTYFDFLNKSISFRAWMKVDPTVDFSAINVQSTSNLSSNLGISMNTTGDGVNCYAAFFGLFVGIGSVAIFTPDMPAGVWYHVVGVYNIITQIARLVINAGTPLTQNIAPALAWGGTKTFQIMIRSSIGTAAYCDEVANWKDYALTDADIAYDYNSGAGRTFPDVP